MEYSVIKKDGFKVARVRKVTESTGGTWSIVKTDGSIEEMQKLAGNNAVLLGLCFGFDGKGYNDNMVGFIPASDDVGAFDIFEYPESKWVKFIAEGKISENALWNTWKYIHKDFLRNSEFKQREELPTAESYLEWDENMDICRVEIGIPVQ